MFDPLSFLLFLSAATVLAVMPGPGIMFVAARALAEGKRAGYWSSIGTGIGGLGQVVAGAAGLSALMLASAEAFTVVKLIGAAYLVWLGLRMWREAGDDLPLDAVARGDATAFRDGIIVELLNPKTAAFLLAFIPQFVDPARGDVGIQFVLLGTVMVALNTGVDIVVAAAAARLRSAILEHRAVVRRVRQGAGLTFCGLGVLLAFARRPA